MYEVLKSRPGWVETQDDVDWDLCWADVGWVRDMYDQIQVQPCSLAFLVPLITVGGSNVMKLVVSRDLWCMIECI